MSSKDKILSSFVKGLGILLVSVTFLFQIKSVFARNFTFLGSPFVQYKKENSFSGIGNSTQDTTICSGDSVLVFVKAMAVSDSVFIKKMPLGDTIIQGIDSVGVYVQSSNVGDFELVVSDNISPVTEMVSISSSAPLASINNLDSIVACYDNDTIRLDASFSSGGTLFSNGYYKYTWTTPDANLNIISSDISTARITQVVENRFSSSKVFLEIEDSLGCSSSDSIITVWDKFVDLDLTDYLLIFCEGDSASSKAFVDGTEVLKDYQWTVITGPASFNVTADTIVTVSGGSNALVEVSATNDLECRFSDTLIAIEIMLETNLSVSETLVCVGETVDLTVTFDSVPNTIYTYQWKVNGVEKSIKKHPSIQITENSLIELLVTNQALGCEYLDTVRVNVSIPVAVAGSLTQDTIRICEDVFSTSVNATSSFDGTPYTMSAPYRYNWSSSESNLTLINTVSNTLTVENTGGLDNYIGGIELEITDSLGCKGIDSVWFEWNNLFRLNVLEDTILFCEGDKDSLNVTDNDLGTFSNYQWNLISGSSSFTVNNDTTLVLSDATNAMFTIVAEDQFGCPSNMDTVFINYVQLDAQLVNLENAYCVEEQVLLGFTFDSVPGNLYYYQWFLNDIVYSNKKDTSFVISADTEVKVRVKDNVLGCVSIDSTTILLSQPTAQAGIVDTLDICNNIFEIGISGNTSFGGVPFVASTSYLYSWSSTEANLELTQETTDSVRVKNLGELNNYIGGIELIITDSLGCTAKDSVWFKWDKQKTVGLTRDTLTFCEGHEDSVKAILIGTGLFTNYDWNLLSGVATFTTQDDSTIIFASADMAVIEILATDINGCEFRDTLHAFDIDVNANLSISRPIVCVNEQVTLSSTYDSLPNHIYEVLWQVDDVDYSSAKDTVLMVSTGVKIKVIVTDVTLGCIDEDSTTISLSIPIANTGIIDTLELCNGVFETGISAKTSTGGTPFVMSSPYLYSWSSSEGNLQLTEETTDSVRIRNLGELNNYIGGVELEITDSLGCTAKDSIWVAWNKVRDVVVSKDTLLFCSESNDSLFAQVQGIGTFTSYNWSLIDGAASFTQNDSIIYLTAADSALIEVTAIDNDGCIYRDTIFTDTEVLEVSISKPFKLACIGDELDLEVIHTNLSLGEYMYVWEVNNVTYSNKADTVFTYTGITDFKVTVNESVFGCEKSASIQVLPSTPVAEIGTDSITVCFDGNNILIPATQTTNGTLPYQYNWSTLDTRVSLNNITNDTVQVTEVTSLEDTFSEILLTVTDSVGCVSKDSVVIEWQKEIQSNIDFESFVCNSINDTIIASPNMTDLTFAWSTTSAVNILGSTSNDTLIYNPNSGTSDVSFTLTLENSDNCTKDTSFVVSLQNLSVNLESISSTTCSNVPVTITAKQSGNSSGLFYNWDGVNFVINNSIKIYTLTNDSTISVSVLDTNTNCVASNFIDITISELVVESNLIIDSICFQDSILLEEISTIGGAGNYKYNWSGGELISPINSSSVFVQPTVLGLDNQTSYILSVEDTLGCESTDTVKISKNNEINSLLIYSKEVCQDSTLLLGEVNNNVNGGSGTFFTLWTSFDGTLSNTSADTTTFTSNGSLLNREVVVTFTDSSLSKCSLQDTILILIEEKPTLTLNDVENVCLNDSLVLKADTTNSLGIDYIWSPNGETTDSIVANDSIVYAVKATSSLGCVNYDTTKIEFLVADTVNLVGDISDFCTGVTKELILEGTDAGVTSWSINKMDGVTDTILNDTIYRLSASILLDTVVVSVHYENVCTDTSFNVSFNADLTPEAQFSFSITEIQQGQEFSLEDESVVGPNLSYQWTVDTGGVAVLSSLMEGPTFTLTEIGSYEAELILRDTVTNCSDTLRKIYNVIEAENLIYVPTALYPEETNLENRVVKVYGVNISNKDFAFEIFNRWGESVYQTNSSEEATDNGWNGGVTSSQTDTDSNITVFTFTLKGQFTDGKIFEKYGTITLIR